MTATASRTHARAAVARLTFDDYLRIGGIRSGTAALLTTATGNLFVKSNHNHDPANGQFTFAGEGAATGEIARSGGQPHSRHHTDAARAYRGAVSKGIGIIKPVSGGTFDASGRYSSEVFAPDPLALNNPFSALQHYLAGSGEPRNYYFSALDTSTITASSFSEIRVVLKAGVPGLHEISDATQTVDFGKPLALHRSTAALVVGRLPVHATGVLAIDKSGRFSFSGFISPDAHEEYDFNASSGRAVWADWATSQGRKLPGKKFKIYFIGSKLVSEAGFIQRSVLK